MKSWSVDGLEEKIREIVREELGRQREEEKEERWSMLAAGFLVLLAIVCFFFVSCAIVMAIFGLLQWLFPELDAAIVAGIAGAIPLTIVMIEYFRFREGI